MPAVISADHDFWGTSDRSSVRTELGLKENESAAVVFIPVQIDSTAPVNFHVRRYGDDGLEVVLNGKGEVQVSIETGPLRHPAWQDVSSDRHGLTRGDRRRQASLEFPLTLDGPVRLRIE